MGTGRFIFSLNYSDADFDAVIERIIAATQGMQRDGWWWNGSQLTDKMIKRKVMKELLMIRLGLQAV